MGEGAQFRNAVVGGFNKEDVLRYIEMMKQSTLESNMKLDQTTRQLQDAQRRIQVLEAQLKQKKEEASRLTADNQSLQARLQQTQEQAQQMSARLSGYEADKSKLQAVETQIGSLMVSAHMYANRIVSQARQEAERITQQASLAIDQATNHINLISVDAESAQGRYQNLFNEVSGKIQALSSSLQEAGEQLQANIRRNVAEAEQALRAEMPLPGEQQADELQVPDERQQKGRTQAAGARASEPDAQQASQSDPPPPCAPIPAQAYPEAPVEEAAAAQEAPLATPSPDKPQESVRQVPDGGIDYSRFVDVLSDGDLFSEE